MRLLPLASLALVFAMTGCAESPSAPVAQETSPTAEVKLSRMTLRLSIAPSDPFDPAAKEGAAVTARRGQVLKLIVEGTLLPGFHTYPVNPVNEKDEHWDFWPENVEGVLFAKSIKETPALDKFISDKKEEYGHLKNFRWEQSVLILADAKPGKIELSVKLRGQVCDHSSCERYKPVLKVSFSVTNEDPLPISPELKAQFKPAPPKEKKSDAATANGKSVAPVPEAAKSTAEPTTPKKQKTIFGLINSDEDQYSETMKNLTQQIIKPDIQPSTGSFGELLSFMLAGVFWGAISLVTPCVFPMIPITVSIFLKQSEKEHHRPVAMALVYSGTIVVVLTLAATFLLSVFRILSVNPYMNYALGLLFIYFALSLFGMYDIELPSGLARFTSAHESQGGYAGIIFMALTFTIISFACVAPFLGGFGGTASGGTSRPMWHDLLGGLAFSVTFAAPFFFLALFPTLLRKMPKSGSWLNSVKVVMGFLEIAAAVKFCRAAELIMTGSEPWLFTFDFALGIYVTLSILCGLYLLGIYRLPHDSPAEHLTVPRLAFAGCFIALGFYLFPALIKDSHGDNVRPRGTLYSWVESFLLPDSSETSNEEPNTANLAVAVEKARNRFAETKQPQRIFVDFTGVNCTNCKINEKSVFTKPYIRELLEPYTVVKLFADQVPTHYYSPKLRSDFGGSVTRQKADADVNLDFQRDNFNNNTQLPLYAILEPQLDGKIRVVGVYEEGRINNENAFAKFLEIAPEKELAEANP